MTADKEKYLERVADLMVEWDMSDADLERIADFAAAVAKEARVKRDKQFEQMKEALEFIAYGKQHSGVIPCPQDYGFYIHPYQDKAQKALAELEQS